MPENLYSSTAYLSAIFVFSFENILILYIESRSKSFGLSVAAYPTLKEKIVVD